MLIAFVDISNSTDERQYDYVLSNFKADVLYVKTRRGFEPTSNIFKTAIRIDSVDDLPADHPLVVFLPQNARYLTPTISLNDFVHPTDAIYMFGPNHENLSTGDDFSNRAPDSLVYIPTDTTDDMYSYNSYAVVMWDRRYG